MEFKRRKKQKISIKMGKLEILQAKTETKINDNLEITNKLVKMLPDTTEKFTNKLITLDWNLSSFMYM
jgi:hypothetical protein